MEKLQSLTDWLKTSIVISDEERTYLETIRQRGALKIDTWNELELRLHFITFILEYVDFDIKESHIRPFAGRELKAEINGEKISGVVDWMIATGIVEPHNPFYFFHEYKPEKGRDYDPLAQVVIAMLAARTANGNTQPLRRVYVLGRNWFFVTLEGNEYAVSDPYVSTLDDIFDIYRILKQVKEDIYTNNVPYTRLNKAAK